MDIHKESVFNTDILHNRKSLSTISVNKSDSTATLVDKCLYYNEWNAGKETSHKLDFDSPRTMEAAAQLGINFDDCLPKYI